MLRENMIAIIGFGVSFLIGSASLAIKYLSMQSIVGGRQWSDVAGFLPRFRALFLPSPDAWIYHWLFEMNLNVSSWYSEMFMFPGIFAIFCVLLCLWQSRLKSMSPAIFCALLWVVIMLSVRYDLWKVVYFTIPGASAIRAVGRIALAGLIPLGICVGFVVESLISTYGRTSSARLRLVLSIALLSIVIVDNGVTPRFGYSLAESQARIDTIKKLLSDKTCKVFHFGSQDTPWKVNIDAMWASVQSMSATVNGYSGHIPPGYQEAGLTDLINATGEGVQRWMALNNISISSSDVCVIKSKVE